MSGCRVQPQRPGPSRGAAGFCPRAKWRPPRLIPWRRRGPRRRLAAYLRKADLTVDRGNPGRSAVSETQVMSRSDIVPGARSPLGPGVDSSVSQEGLEGRSSATQGGGSRLDSPKRTGGQRALLEAPGCASCGRLLTGRQRGACSPRCRARLSRQRQAAAEASRRATEGPWRFRVQPAGRRFGWRGAVFASDRTTGVLEVHDAGFAAALRAMAKQDSIAELP